VSDDCQLNIKAIKAIKHITTAVYASVIAYLENIDLIAFIMASFLVYD
jgi:hypothetical protein